MAKQCGVVPLTGTIGGINFYIVNGNHLARAGTSLNKERFYNDPCFENSRAHVAEFGRASAAGGLLRYTLHPLLQHLPKQMISGKLNSILFQVIKTDPISDWGQRHLSAGNLALLKGFEFNPQCSLQQVLPVTINTAINRHTGDMTVNIPSFNPRKIIKAPAGATHYRVVSAGSVINPQTKTKAGVYAESELLPLNATVAAPIQQQLQVPFAEELPIFLTTGIVFFHVAANGTVTGLKAGALCVMEAGVMEVAVAETVIATKAQRPALPVPAGKHEGTQREVEEEAGMPIMSEKPVLEKYGEVQEEFINESAIPIVATIPEGMPEVGSVQQPVGIKSGRQRVLKAPVITRIVESSKQRRSKRLQEVRFHSIQKKKTGSQSVYDDAPNISGHKENQVLQVETINRSEILFVVNSCKSYKCS